MSQRRHTRVLVPHEDGMYRSGPEQIPQLYCPACRFRELTRRGMEGLLLQLECSECDVLVELWPARWQVHTIS